MKGNKVTSPHRPEWELMWDGIKVKSLIAINNLIKLKLMSGWEWCTSPCIIPYLYYNNKKRIVTYKNNILIIMTVKNKRVNMGVDKMVDRRVWGLRLG